MVESSILSVTESFGERIIVNLQLGDLRVLISSDSNKLSVRDWNDDLWLTGRLKYNLHRVLMHSVEKYLYGFGKWKYI